MIASSSFWIVVIFLGIGTFGIRASFIFFSDRIKLSNRAKEVLSFIPAAVLPALITPIVFYHQGSVELIMGKERFLVLFLASVLCYFFRNMLVTILFGLSLLFFMTTYL